MAKVAPPEACLVGAWLLLRQSHGFAQQNFVLTGFYTGRLTQTLFSTAWFSVASFCTDSFLPDRWLYRLFLHPQFFCAGRLPHRQGGEARAATGRPSPRGGPYFRHAIVVSD